MLNFLKNVLALNLIDIDECKEGNHNCSNFATCINVNQGYDCECHLGFVGDGVTCRGTHDYNITLLFLYSGYMALI